MMSTLVIGEALVDVFTSADGTQTRRPGGSPLNVAVGLARLGRQARFLTRIGPDDDGAMLVDHLQQSGVDVSRASCDSRPTSVAHATLDGSGSASYEFDIVSQIPAPPTDRVGLSQLVENAPRAVHVGSIGAHLAPGAATVLEWVKIYHRHSTITYDPNVRLSITGSAAGVLSDIDALMPYVDVVKASDEDVEQLLGITDPVQAAQYFLDRGARLAVISLGGSGLYLATTSTSVKVAAAKVEVVDTVGAGDSLMAALIDGLGRFSALGGQDTENIDSLSPAQLSSLGAYGATAAGISVTRAGANPPTREELTIQSNMYATH